MPNLTSIAFCVMAGITPYLIYRWLDEKIYDDQREQLLRSNSTYDFTVIHENNTGDIPFNGHTFFIKVKSGRKVMGADRVSNTMAFSVMRPKSSWQVGIEKFKKYVVRDPNVLHECDF